MRAMAFACLLLLLGPFSGATKAQDLSDNQTCLACHGNEGFSTTRGDGTTRALHVPPDRFQASVHAPLPCIACHQQVTEIPHKEGVQRKVDCGMCHADEMKAYLGSVHGTERAKGNLKAADCSSCHSMHAIGRAKDDATRLAIVRSCGSCHNENFTSYMDTYHGQVNRLGYAYTAKCFDCHGNHGIQRVTDPRATVHPDNRLRTCQKCHTDATPGFVSFQPHANTHDFARYPQMWIVSKFMVLLLAGVFAFFWTHSALWFYREWRERGAQAMRTHVDTLKMPKAGEPYVRRWPAGWRLLHLLFALSVMTLVLTGMSVFYAGSTWAPVVMDAIGGPRVAAIVHRSAATVFVSIFFGHFVYVVIKLARHWRTFDWFGPDSLVPNLKDLRDAVAMFRWFFGKGPRPMLDRFSYWEKFDYWAPFWGVFIIGTSGLMLWAKTVTAAFLPGWVFNVATLFHGEEAFLAAVFLFTVHFFNNHIRPDKFPLDTQMFTGVLPLEEYRREHPIEYDRLVKTGELEKYLVQAPSRPMALGSRILGFTLLAIGFTLLALVLTGFVQNALQGM